MRPDQIPTFPPVPRLPQPSIGLRTCAAIFTITGSAWTAGESADERLRCPSPLDEPGSRLPNCLDPPICMSAELHPLRTMTERDGRLHGGQKNKSQLAKDPSALNQTGLSQNAPLPRHIAVASLHLCKTVGNTLIGHTLILATNALLFTPSPIRELTTLPAVLSLSYHLCALRWRLHGALTNWVSIGNFACPTALFRHLQINETLLTWIQPPHLPLQGSSMRFCVVRQPMTPNAPQQRMVPHRRHPTLVGNELVQVSGHP